jgi:hypothetical protein
MAQASKIYISKITKTSKKINKNTPAEAQKAPDGAKKEARNPTGEQPGASRDQKEPKREHLARQGARRRATKHEFWETRVLLAFKELCTVMFGYVRLCSVMFACALFAVFPGGGRPPLLEGPSAPQNYNFDLSSKSISFQNLQKSQKSSTSTPKGRFWMIFHAILASIFNQMFNFF